MEKTRLGRTDLMVSRTSFGALPIQRITVDESTKILRKAYEAGINFFDTARSYTNSEEKIGYALSDVRENIIIATKSQARNREELEKHLATSLKNLRTDYIDILQFHNPSFMPIPGEENGLYDAIVQAKEKGFIRYIGITNHRLDLTKRAIESGLYDTVQFPLSSISSQEDLNLVKECRDNDIGLIAMKALSGGLINNAASTFAFLRQYENLVPIWGIQREWELDEFLSFEDKPPKLDKDMWKIIEKDREDLGGSFCRSCGYCMPCSVDIPIPNAARMSLLLTRSPYERYMTDEWRRDMDKINDCTQCGLCKTKCPYGLDIPNLLQSMLENYDEFYSNYKAGNLDK